MIESLLNYYDPLQSLLAGLGIYLFMPVINGVSVKNYSLLDKWDKRFYAGVEMALSDMVGQWVADGSDMLSKGTKEPINAVTTGVVFGAARKMINGKDFLKSTVSAVAIDSVAIVMTPNMTFLKPNKVKAIASGTKFNTEVKNYPNVIPQQQHAKKNNNVTVIKQQPKK